MTKTAIISLIKNPESIEEKHIPLLAELGKKYTWCQPLQLLYTKGLHNTKSIEYLDSLKYTAAITVDRKLLYQHIMQASLLKKIEALEQVITETPVVKLPETVTPIVEETKSIPKEEENSTKIIFSSREILEEILDEKLKSFTHSETIDVNPTTENISTEEVKETEISIGEKLASNYSELEKQILWEAVNSSIQIDAVSEISKLPELESPIVSKVLDEELNKYNDEQIEIDFKSKQSFFTWLAPRNPEKEEISPEKQIEQQQTEDLIDKFLKSDPKITPQKIEFYTPGNMAKLSITDNEDFVSETLAVIYIKQGYYPKALRVFEKLSLKFPEKSAYFAARIKEVVSLQKNSKQK